MRFLGTYECGYAGCDEYHLILADSLSDAQFFMAEGLSEYVSDHEYLARRAYEEDRDVDDDATEEYEASDEEWYNSQDYEDFATEYCNWYVEEIPENGKIDIEEKLGFSKYDWEDIRHS